MATKILASRTAAALVKVRTKTAAILVIETQMVTKFLSCNLLSSLSQIK